MNFFISQPMNNRSEDDIIAERVAVIHSIKRENNNAHILDSFLTGAKDVNPLVCLGHSITILSKADVAVFCEGWEDARGCQIEYQCCKRYNIPIYIYDRDIDEIFMEF